MILSDPPYADVEAYGRLAEWSAAHGAPLTLAYAGGCHLDKVFAAMGKHLPYYWLFAIDCAGQHCAIHPRQIQAAWKPIVAFGRPRRHEYMTDLLRGNGRQKKRHDWEQPQSEAQCLIERLTEPGELVCDPFWGSGTVLAAAKSLGRQWIGCDSDANAARVSRRRLAA